MPINKVNKKARRFLPVFIDLSGKRCVVIGGGKVAERKIRSLLKTGADITVISPEVTQGIKRLTESKAISLIKRPFQRKDIRDAFLVIAATSSRELHKMISKNFKGLLNVVNDPELCNFIMPSIVKRGPLIIAISSSGSSPAIVKAIRKELQSLYNRAFGEYIEHMGKIRNEIINLPPHKKKRLINSIASDEVFKRLRQYKKAGPVIKNLLGALYQKEKKR